jgi:hypothetical protein
MYFNLIKTSYAELYAKYPGHRKMEDTNELCLNLGDTKANELIHSTSYIMLNDEFGDYFAQDPYKVN